MTIEDIVNAIEAAVLRLEDGNNPEDDRLEIKSQWYKLRDPAGKPTPAQIEFLKDLCALANAPGATALLMIGIDKTGKIVNSPFSQCGLRDKVDLRSMVIKYVESPVEFTLHELPYPRTPPSSIVSVIEIPPSRSKPHIIGQYTTASGTAVQNYIPIRKLTGTFAANRSDLNGMYLDTARIVPEYALELSGDRARFLVSTTTSSLTIKFPLVFQNTGQNPIALVEAYVEVYSQDRAARFRIVSYDDGTGERFITEHYLTIEPDKVRTLTLKCHQQISSVEPFSLLEDKKFQFVVSCSDSHGRIYNSNMLTRNP